MKPNTFCVILLGGFLMISIPSLVYAEQYELMNSEDNCVATQTNLWNGTRFHLVCEWDKFEPKDANDITGGPPEPKPDPTIECVDPQVLYEGQCVFPKQPSIPTEDPVVVDEEDKPDEQTEREDMINDNIEESCRASMEDPDDLLKYDLCRSWQLAGECERGINESAPVQTHGFFLTTDFILSQWRHHDLDTAGALTVLTSANLECFYQRTILEPITLGVRYGNLAKADAVIDLDHQERAEDIFQPIHPQELTPAVHATTQKVATDALCANRNYISAWLDYGCPHARPQVYTGVGIDLTGDNIDEHRKYLANPTEYRPPVIKGWFSPGECYSNSPCEWKIEIP